MVDKEYYKIQVVSGEDDLINDLLELALELSLYGKDVRTLIRLAQILFKSESIDK